MSHDFLVQMAYLQFHDSFYPRIGEPNRGGGRDTQI